MKIRDDIKKHVQGAKQWFADRKPSKRNTAFGPQIREVIKKRGSNKVAASIVAVSFVGAVQTATLYFA